MQSVHQKPDIHELIGEQQIVSVVEDRPQFDGTGRGVDLVIHRGQSAALDHMSLRPVIRLGGEFRAGFEPQHDRSNAVFRHRK